VSSAFARSAAIFSARLLTREPPLRSRWRRSYQGLKTDEVQPLKMLSRIGAIIADGTGGGRQQADPLVIPDGFDLGAGRARQFADAESFFHGA
jgi:hypothetical protein